MALLGRTCSLVFIPMIHLWVTTYPRNAISTGFYSPIKEGPLIASTPLPRLFSEAGFLCIMFLGFDQNHL